VIESKLTTSTDFEYKEQLRTEDIFHSNQ